MNLHKRTRGPETALIEMFHRRFGSHWDVWIADGALYYRDPAHPEHLTSTFMDTVDKATSYFRDFFAHDPDFDARNNR